MLLLYAGRERHRGEAGDGGERGADAGDRGGAYIYMIALMGSMYIHECVDRHHVCARPTDSCPVFLLSFLPFAPSLDRLNHRTSRTLLSLPIHTPHPTPPTGVCLPPHPSIEPTIASSLHTHHPAPPTGVRRGEALLHHGLAAPGAQPAGQRLRRPARRLRPQLQVRSHAPGPGAAGWLA